MRIHFSSVFAALVMIGVQSFAAADRPTLRGRVIDPDGKPVAGSTVMIFSAGPRIGTSSFCPTCYPDCRKKSETDANGEFKIEQLDPTLLFRLLVVNKDYKPQFVPRTDPLAAAAAIKVEPRKNDFPEHHALRARVVTPTGEPIPRAVVSFEFFFGKEANCGGQCDGVDLVAVTDRDGRFVIGAEKQFDWMTVQVETPGYARRKFFQLSSEKNHELKMTEGATVTGRAVKDSKPMAGIGIGLVSVDKSDNFTGNYDTFTDDEGNFHFFNVPPYQMYFVYSLLEKSAGDFVVPATRIRVAADGSIKDVGDLPLLKGAHLKGKIQLSDGKPFPPNLQVTLGRNGAWDWKLVSVAADGTFETTGVPAEEYSLGVRVPGYTISGKNKSLDRLNGGSLVGRIDGDLFVTVLMDPGQFQQPDFRALGNFGPHLQPYDKPLEGVLPDSL
jgi:uncharacterized GH25 family protein